MSNKFSLTALNIPKELFLVTGGISGGAKTEWEPLSDSFFAKRIPETQKHYIAPINTWQTRIKYNKYVSVDNYTTVYNEDNQTVYLCLHNHPDFRDDLEPGLSVQQPSHSSGRQTYEDGYTWLPLFKVDFTEWEFIAPGEIPVPKIETETDYTTFSQKYEPLCGPKGVTSFGCCCLYFKENSVDEVTGEVYTAGDVTNESIFSDCYECQKLAEALDRDVTFLSGTLPSGITLTHPLENPLCPATKTIKTLKEQLQEQQYTIVPGSSKEYQLFLLNNHNNKGIMAVGIDLDGLTDAQKTISVDNPVLNVADPLGSGATVKIKTNPIGLSSHFIYGIELVTEGSEYGELPVVNNISNVISSVVQDRITLIPYDSEIYTNPQTYAKPNKLKASITVTNNEVASLVPAAVQHTKIAVMTDPKFLSTSALAEYTKNDSSTQRLPTIVTLYKPSTVVDVGA